jgi:hypothetical protein
MQPERVWDYQAHSPFGIDYITTVFRLHPFALRAHQDKTPLLVALRVVLCPSPAELILTIPSPSEKDLENRHRAF